MPRCKLITEVLQKAGFIEKSGQGVDKMFYHCLMDGKCLPDYSLTDEVTLHKLIDEGLLISAQDGYKLSDRYYEIVKNVGTIEDNRKDDTVNVPLNDTVKSSQLTEIQCKIFEAIESGMENDTINAQTLSDALGASVITIKRDLYVLRDLNLIKYVGSNKTGHWEIISE